MKRLVYLFVISLSSMAFTTYAQEICNNGIDDDNDGFIDCFDSSCANNTQCDGSYIGNDALCEARPAEFPAFRMTLDWASENRVTNHLNRMSIGDLDRDGIPEVVVTNIEDGNGSRGVYILRGSNGTTKYSEKNLPFTVDREVAIANLDDDNCAEIFLTGTQSGNRYIYAYNCDLTTQIWRSPALPGDPGLFALADFNGDGQVELYFRDWILNAHTGAKIAESSADYFNDVTGSPVAVDIVGDQNLELVNGLRIFTVNIGAGTITQHSNRSEYFLRNSPDGSHTSVADFNLDGNLDIIASGSTIANNTNTTIFYWNVAANTLKTYSNPIAGNFSIQTCTGATGYSTGEYYKNGWHRGTGRINIADADGDTLMNLVYVSGKYLYALYETPTKLDTLWRKQVSEETSGYTGCSMFDFNGDGQTEIVYRDERKLYIINGTNGSTYTSQACISRTARDYPIVADIDADGQSELCVTCGFDNALAAANFCDIEYSENSHVRVYRTDLEPWVPARRLWNQNAYFNVNVNDDLTIPRIQQKQQTVFSKTGCGPTGARWIRPLNSFLNQAPFLNSLGCPKYASPDLAYVNNSLVVNTPTCPNKDFTISFTIQNLGDVPVTGNVPVTFYKGNPLAAGAIRLNTITANLNNFTPGSQFIVSNATVNGDGSNFTLFIAINDSGTTAIPITFPNTTFLECNYDNIISAAINPLPVPVTALLIQDNLKCVGSASPDNGAVRAFVQVGAIQNTTDYNFYWSNGATVTSPVSFTGAVYSSRPAGSYTVYALHKTAICSSDTATVVVNRVDRSVDAVITKNSDNTSCVSPTGSLQASVTGQPVSNYNFEWYRGNDIFTAPKIGVSDIMSGLVAGTYTVLVTDKTTGCQATESMDIVNTFSIPVPVTVVTNIICSSANSGALAATVNGGTAGFTFRWYNGSNVKPAPDFTGATYASRTAGNYTLVVVNNASGCTSTPVTYAVTQSTAPVVSVAKTSDQTSCDATLPNGAANANVSGGTSGYNFEWFRGQNTLLANRVATTPNVTGLTPGIYTVKASDALTGCFDTDEITINFAVVTPVLLLAGVGDLTDCRTPNGSISVSVSPDSPSDYTFSWYNGTVVDGTPDYTFTGNNITGLNIGTYTVQAVHNTKHCTTAPITATIVDNTPTINIQTVASVQQLPTDCNTSNGVMGVLVTAAGNTGGFLLEWFKNSQTTPFFTQTVPANSTATGLGSGNYTIRATNLDNGCVASRTFALPFADAHELTLVSKNDATTCAPQNEGSIIVKLEPTPTVVPGPPPVSFTVADYEIFIYEGIDETGTLKAQITGAAGAPNGDGTSNYTSTTLTPGFYTFVAVENNPLLSGCKSVPVVVEILPFEVNPVITVSTTTNNTNCAGVVLANGQLVAVADGAPPVNYTFNWFDGADITAPPVPTTSGVNGNSADNLDAGLYTVQVVNNATQCSSVATFPIFNNPPMISVSSGDLTISALTRCDVVDGSVELISIQENGSPAPLGSYTIQWFDGSMNPISTANPLNNLVPGNYFMQATNTVNNCSNALVEFVIEDQTINSVLVELTSFTDPTRCLKPTNILGELVTLASGNSTLGYTSNWYNGTVVAGAPFFTGTTLSNIAITPPATSVSFTVEVINNSNDCRVIETYTVPLVTDQPVLIASAASPMTNCVVDNGVVFATINNNSSNDYTYNWYIGSAVTASPNFTGKQVNNLPIGLYTVEAIDNLDNFCTAGPLTVEIVDGRENPVVTAIESAPLTVCDLTRADGVAMASVNGSVTNHIFDWYVGLGVSGTPFYTGAQASGLSDQTYTVQATDVLTGCRGERSITISNKVLTIPAPTVVVVSNVTACDPLAITPTPVDNGELAASINGNTSDYIFDWDNGTTYAAPADFTGDIYGNLAQGQYTVQATSRSTGCISPPATGQILEDLKLPDFNFSIGNASCDESNGFISFNLLNDLTVSTAEWMQNGLVISTEPVLLNVPEGVYSLRVRSSDGCPAEKEVAVGTEIRPFNGISRGGHNVGQNDLFTIACIESFPTNYVKIYNRAGTLVYSAEGYDNIDIYFDGKSNKGISPLGNNLPDGTYFYVIDKNDGSKPLAGYLEIVN